jgi:hypothetical protein
VFVIAITGFCHCIFTEDPSKLNRISQNFILRRAILEDEQDGAFVFAGLLYPKPIQRWMNRFDSGG